MRWPSPIRCATTLSLAGHAALFLILGTTSFLRADVESVPTLQFTLDTEDGRDLEKDNAPHTERVVQLGPTSKPPSAAIPDDRPSEIDPDYDTGKSEPAPRPPEANENASGPPPENIVVADSGDAISGDIVTTSGASDYSVPASEAAVEQAAISLATIPTAQQQLMTRKVLRWAQGLQDAPQTPSLLSWEQDGREYTAVLKRRPAASNTDIESAIVEIATIEDGKALRTRLHLKRLAFSHFTQLVDRWDASVQLHDDEVVGRFHSNSEITLGYDRAVAPRFMGKVTTAAGGFAISSWSGLRPRGEIFRGGLETRVGHISLPQRFLKPTSSPAVGSAQFHTFDRDTRITFYSDGTYGWQRLDKRAREERAPLGKMPMLMIAGRGTELRVRGTVHGNVLVYSPEKISVESSLVYADNPRLLPGAQDYLGLASDQFIEVAPPAVTGPGDIEIDAAVYARRRFTVTEELAPGRATLFIFGSLTAGTLSATEPRFATRVEFDERFEHTRPPGFPMTNHYEVEQWDGQWEPEAQ